MIHLIGILKKENSMERDNSRCEMEENKRWTKSIEQRICELRGDIELLRRENTVYSEEGITKISEIILELQAIVTKNRGRLFKPKDENFLLRQ